MGSVNNFVHPSSVVKSISNKSLFIESGVHRRIHRQSRIDDFKNAIHHAQVAFDEYRKTTEYERVQMLHRYAALIRTNAKGLAVILVMENGKTLAEAENEVEYGASFITWFAEEAIRSYGDVISSRNRGNANFTIRQPIGVCAIIAPWNFPVAMITRKLGSALAAGCTCVIKPPSETPLSTLALTKLAIEAGIPPNVIQVVPTRDRDAVTELYTNPGIRKVSFTGSTGVGKMITAKAAGTMKKVSMELGGNAPYIVFDDADLETAVDNVLVCKFRCSGQTCVCANRLYVQRGIHDKFVDALLERMKKFKIGSGIDPSVTHGPLVNKAAVEKVRSHIDDATGKGARLVIGGNVWDDLGGYFIEPALMTGVTSDMLVARDETFGPLAPVFVFDMVDEVLKMVGDTEFGLAGYFFSSNLKTIWRVAGELEVGMVGVNTAKISAAEAPFGGVKESGVGREGSKYGLEEFQVMKNIVVSV